MLSEMDGSQLSWWVQRFVLEAKKKDGTEFQPTTLHHIVAGLCTTFVLMANWK